MVPDSLPDLSPCPSLHPSASPHGPVPTGLLLSDPAWAGLDADTLGVGDYHAGRPVTASLLRVFGMRGIKFVWHNFFRRRPESILGQACLGEQEGTVGQTHHRFQCLIQYSVLTTVLSKQANTHTHTPHSTHILVYAMQCTYALRSCILFYKQTDSGRTDRISFWLYTAAQLSQRG